jgi:tRNA threonylcarbamoyladenosine biosynthesis protein TsaB
MSEQSTPGWVLALDTSTDWAGVAVTDGRYLAEQNWLAGRRQTSQVMPEIERLLATAAVPPAELSAVAVATGPGSFSGLRVGMAIANGLAVAAGVPTIGVSTLAISQRPWAGLGLPVVAVVKAGRHRYGWGSDSAGAGPVNGTIVDLVEYLRQVTPAIVVGELDDEDAVRIRELAGATVPHVPDRLRRAASLASMGWDIWRAGEYDPGAILEPTYLHRT